MMFFKKGRQVTAARENPPAEAENQVPGTVIRHKDVQMDSQGMLRLTSKQSTHYITLDLSHLEEYKHCPSNRITVNATEDGRVNLELWIMKLGSFEPGFRTDIRNEFNRLLGLIPISPSNTAPGSRT